MKYITFLVVVIIAACNNNGKQNPTVVHHDSIQVDTNTAHNQNIQKADTSQQEPRHKIYSNTRFKDVTVEKTGEHTYVVKGKGQVFEASFGWAVEDGHNELKKGFQSTDAGAPEWGNFSFIVDVPKERENSTLTLVLSESSAKDGSRVYELPIVLY